MEDALQVFGLCCSVGEMSKPREAGDREPHLGRLGAIPVGVSREQPDSPARSVDVTFPKSGGRSEEIQTH